MAHRIICIETSTGVCSVCLSENGHLIALKEDLTPNKHSSELAVFIEELLASVNWKPNTLDAVALSKGPGSYTGLRIGASTAQGLCYTLNIPLIGINTLFALANQAITHYYDAQAQYAIAMEAKGKEIYWAIYNTSLKCLQEPTIVTLSTDIFEDFLPKQLIIGGPAAKQCEEYVQQKAKIFLPYEQNRCSAVNLIKPAIELYNKRDFENIAYFEPFYVKQYHLLTT